MIETSPESTRSPVLMAGPVQLSPTVGALFAALAKAQANMTIAGKDREVVEKRKSKASGREFETKRSYATLASTMEAVRPHLAAQGVSITQWPTRDERGNVQVTTILGHSSGQWMSGTFSTDPNGMQQRGVQALGSSISYLRRYCAQAVCGVAQADDDDDGAAASTPGPKRARRKQTPKKPKPATSAKPPNPDHHPDWPGDRARFCAALKEHMGGMKYEDLAAFESAHGRRRPSGLSNEARQILWRELQSGKADEVVEWCAIQAAAKGEA